MRKLLFPIVAVVLALGLLLSAGTVASAPPSPGYGWAGGAIFLDDYGRSGSTWVPGIHNGDVLSGDLATNLQYRGITDRGWLNSWMDTPGEACRGEGQLTGSLWTVVTPMTAVTPPAGALSDASSKIAKDDTAAGVKLEMDIRATVWDTQTRMGTAPSAVASVLSRNGVLELTYTLKNVGSATVLQPRFYVYLHPHPNGSCYDIDGVPSHWLSAIEGRYDTTFYAIDDANFPDSAAFHHDLTFWAPALTGSDGVVYPGSTIGIAAIEGSSSRTNNTWGIGSVGKWGVPYTDDLVWKQIEANNLQKERQGTAGELSLGGALGFNLPSLARGQSVAVRVILALSDEIPSP